MSFKLIARDNKINIYDAYADKYHVVENDEELSKLIDENGKLLPDEQLRQYFATKESKSRKIQKGFTTKKANLKKEYGDVEKQIFKDVVKYKIYSKYGNALSNDDINAFNKNPTAETIKKFKSLRSEIRDEAADTFKEYEKQYQQDYNDKNNLASILSAYQQMNKDTPLSQVMMSSVILQMMKSDINILKNGNEEAKKEAAKKLKENAVALPLVPVAIQNEIKKLDEKNIDTKALEEAIDKEEKKIEVKQERDDATKYQIPGEVLYGNAKEQFDKSNKLKNFDITPLQTLHKNLTFLNSSENKFNTLNDDGVKIEEQPNKPTTIELDFGDNGEFQFKYTIDPATPYYNEIIPAIKTLEEKPNYEEFQKAYNDMEDRISNFDSADYTVVNKNSFNAYTFTNKYNSNKEEEVKYPEEYKKGVKNAQIMQQMSNPEFDVEEFQAYINAITDNNWFDTMEPTITFDTDSESYQYKKFNRNDKNIINKRKLPRNAFIHALQHPEEHFYKRQDVIKHLEDVAQEESADYVNKLKADYAEYQEELKENENAKPSKSLFTVIENEKDIDKIPKILEATILHQKIIGDDEMPTILPTNLSYPQLKKNDRKEFTEYNKIMNDVHVNGTDAKIYAKLSKDEDFQKIYEDVSNAVDENLNKGYYWYYDTDTIKQLPMSFYGDHSNRIFPVNDKGEINKKYRNADLANDINVISREIYNPYGYKYVTEKFFSEGMIRDMLALKLNKK